MENRKFKAEYRGFKVNNREFSVIVAKMLFNRVLAQQMDME